MRKLLLTGGLAALAAGAAFAQAGMPPSRVSDEAAAARTATLEQAVANPERTPANLARDRYRHPVETLRFFGVEPDDTVVEIWPGGGWYTEILAPYVAGRGALWLAAPQRQQETLVKRQTERPNVWGKGKLAVFPASGDAGPRVPDGSADVVLTFRNVHNWQGSEGGTAMAAEAFRQMYAMLKPGGRLGVVEHRLPEGADATREIKSGYMKVATVRKLAEDAGFRFVAASEVNANPKDTADYPDGVWTLPPVLRGGDVDREKYVAIGESDRMTLRFTKPRG